MSSIFLDSERTLQASAADARVEIKDALLELGCSITSEQLTQIQAKRGSMVAGALALHNKLPVSVTIAIAAGIGGVTVTARLADHLASPVGRTWGMNGSYETLMREMQSRLDEHLAKLDPAAVFEPPQFTSRTHSIGVLESSTRLTEHVSGAAVAKATEVLEGGPRTRVPPAWQDLDTVILSSPDGAARLDLQELQAHLAVAMLVTAHPGSMPPALVSQVEAFAVRIEAELNRAASKTQVEIAVSVEEKPVVEFLHQQAMIREHLPVRTLHRCQTCKLEKITNPDYERLQKRNQRLRNIVGSVGATVSSSGVSPFILVGTVMRFAKLDPDYVCARCQGTEADAYVVTYCPRCGDMRPEAVLRSCAKCKLDLRGVVTKDELWEPYPASLPAASPATMATPGPVSVGGWSPPAGSAPTPSPLAGLTGTLLVSSAPARPAAPVPPPAPIPPPPPQPLPSSPLRGPNGGKLCTICGREFSTLWRVRVPVGGAEQELLVCGTPPRCSPQSTATPTPA